MTESRNERRGVYSGLGGIGLFVGWLLICFGSIVALGGEGSAAIVGALGAVLGTITAAAIHVCAWLRRISSQIDERRE